MRYLIVSLIATVVFTPGQSFSQDFDLSGKWQLTGRDTVFPFLEWTALLTIEQGNEPGARKSLQGSFEWLGQDNDGITPGTITGFTDFEDGRNGTESFYDTSTQIVHIEDFQIRNASSTVVGYTLGIGTYEADVSDNGIAFTNGNWGGSPGDFEAAKLVPEPSGFIIALLIAATLSPNFRKRWRS